MSAMKNEQPATGSEQFANVTSKSNTKIDKWQCWDKITYGVQF